jgi:predicted MFS family arabinose efflux permease
MGDRTVLSGYQWRLLAILALINFVNFADRTVILPLFPLLRADFALTSEQLGRLQLVLQVVLSAATIPFALLADRISRTRLIAFGVVFWSLATFLTGFAGSFAMLLVARALVGVGEASYAPAAQSMISGAFPPASRARAQAVFAAGMLIGGTLGQAAGGVVGEAMGWRPAFFLVGVPGLILALLILRLPEPPRPPRTELVPLGALFRVPAYLAMIGSGVLVTFASIAMITWGADFVVRFKGFGLREAGVSLGLTVLAATVPGVIAGGWLADRLQRLWPWGRVVGTAVAFLAGAPFGVLALYAETRVVLLGAFFAGAFFLSFYHGPVTAVIHDLMPVRAHATSVGFYMFVTQLIGGTAGPWVVGRLDDVADLRAGLVLAMLALVAGAFGLLLVAWFIRRDGLHHPAVAHFRSEAD